MSTLKVRLLGPPSVHHQAEPVTLRPMELHLLAFLLLQRGRPVHRDIVASALWSDGDDEICRRRLSTTLWRLRARLEPAPDDVVIGANSYGNLFVNMDDIDLDVADFERDADGLVRTGRELRQVEADRLRRALSRYGGDLLEGVYDEWVLREREGLLSLYLSALTYLVGWHQRRHEPHLAIPLAQIILDRDPLREDAHRALIRCYAETGARTQAIEQYRRCAALLSRELGVPPLPETMAAMVAAHRGETSLPPSAPVPAGDLLRPLLGMRGHVEALREAVDGAIEQLRGLS